MKEKKRYLKNPIFQLCLVLLLTSCGGGGGGGGPRSVGPSQVAGNKGGMNGILPIDPQYEKPTVPVVDTKGESLIVGILDSDFLTNKDELQKKYGNKIVILEKSEKNYTNHGEIVLDTFFEGISPTVIAASLSAKNGNQNIIKFSLEDYKTILKKMQENDKNGEKKLKIFNQSWGSTLSAKTEREVYSNKETFRGYLLQALSEKTTGNQEEILKSGQEALEFYDRAVNNENALFIWANGNYDSNNQELYNAGLQAAAPYGKASLEKGWISVVGINGYTHDNYSPKHLAYAGVASNWSISADGNAQGKYGSSFAAPRVANAAVQVGEKFSWMTNNEVRMTLFTTTNKLGVGDGLDEESRYINSTAMKTNGWGVLNTKRALKGPGAFWKVLLETDYRNLDTTDWNYYFNANIPANTISYFENNIYGDSGLKKRGDGTLVLTGENKFDKKSKIEGGRLEIYKTHASGVDIGKSGTLVLHNDSVVGYYKSEIGNEEKLSAVINEGKLEVSGDRAFVGEYINKNGELNITQGNKLTVLNKANVENLVVNLDGNGYVPPTGAKEEILEAKNLVGNVSGINVDGMRNVALEKSGDKLVATVSRENAVTYLGEARTSSVDTAKKIENTLKELDERYENGTLDKNGEELGASILEMTTDEFKKTTEIVSGEIYASAQALNFLQAQNINRGISNHLAALKNFYESDFDWQGWVSFQNTNGRLSQDGYSSAETDINGGHFGVDKRVGNNQVGAAISYSYGKADFDRYAGKYTSDSVGISLYGKRYFEDKSYILSRIGITNFDTEVNRALLAQDGSTQNGKINHNDTMYSGYLEAGKHFKYLTPYVAYSIDILNREGFNESEASWGIVSGDKRYLQQNIILGIQGEYKIDESLRLTSHITQQINIGDRDLSFKGHFVNSSTEYQFKGIEQVKNTTWIGVGVEKDITTNFGIGVNLDMRLNEYKKEDVQISTNIYYRF